jgi:hypothetical protein
MEPAALISNRRFNVDFPILTQAQQDILENGYGTGASGFDYVAWPMQQLDCIKLETPKARQLRLRFEALRKANAERKAVHKRAVEQFTKENPWYEGARNRFHHLRARLNRRLEYAKWGRVSRQPSLIIQPPNAALQLIKAIIEYPQHFAADYTWPYGELTKPKNWDEIKANHLKALDKKVIDYSQPVAQSALPMPDEITNKHRFAFKCQTCGALEPAETAGQNEVPGACHICRSGVELTMGQDGFTVTHHPENWIKLWELSARELAAHGLHKEDVVAHTHKGKLPKGKALDVTATEGIGGKDRG